jgi:hypothetical protein
MGTLGVSGGGLSGGEGVWGDGGGGASRGAVMGTLGVSARGFGGTEGEGHHAER